MHWGSAPKMCGKALPFREGIASFLIFPLARLSLAKAEFRKIEGTTAERQSLSPTAGSEAAENLSTIQMSRTNGAVQGWEQHINYILR